jgi:Derlin-2/3
MIMRGRTVQLMSLLLAACLYQTDARQSWPTFGRGALSRPRLANFSPLALREGQTSVILTKDGLQDEYPLFDSQQLRRLFDTRGGAILGDSDDEEEEEDYSDEEDDDALLFGLDGDEDDFGDDEFAQSDFDEDSSLERMVDAFRKTPPLTKAYLTGSVLATLYGYVCHQNNFPPILSLEWSKVGQKLQLWRPLTAFFNFGPFGFGYLMTAHFVWTYMSTLERLSYRQPYDFWIMILFGQLSMVIGYPLLKLSPRFLGHNLSTFLVYIWARYHEGLEVNLFELFNTRAELLPWFFLAQTFLLEGELPVLDFLGIVFGHIYHYCKTVGVLRAPKALVDWYEGDSLAATQIRDEYKQISSDFEMI